MKTLIVISSVVLMGSLPVLFSAQTKKEAFVSKSAPKHLYLDVHHLQPGKVKFEDVAAAHLKDLATEKKYGVDFMKYWVNEEEGLVFCLSSAYDSALVRATHAEAHGLIPEQIYEVTEGTATALKGKMNLYMDIHYLGAGNVTKEAVADAHIKDLAIQKKYGTNFVDYWVDEKEGVVICLAQAENPGALIATHKEAHGLIPATVVKVTAGK